MWLYWIELKEDALVEIQKEKKVFVKRQKQRTNRMWIESIMLKTLIKAKKLSAVAAWENSKKEFYKPNWKKIKE